MIAGIFHEGSGLGDQLFRYITVRTLAEEKGYEWGMGHTILSWEGAGFKGKEFISLQYKLVFPQGMKEWNEKSVRDSQDNDIRSYDPEINFVEDNTIIDGSFEDSKYWGHNLENINKWLTVEPLTIPDDLCIIGFRGGEYAGNPDLFLPKEYYDEAIAKMREINPDMQFQVHTDDPTLAQTYFPGFEIVKNKPISHSKHTAMGFNWRSARYAKYAIIPNSAFFIIPRILKHHETPVGLKYRGHEFKDCVTIAPRYWARHNQKVWARPACWYKPFLYV